MNRKKIFKFFYYMHEDHYDNSIVGIKERVHSETKIMDKTKLDHKIVPFALFCSKSVSFPFNTNSSHKISLPGPALSLPGTCIIASRGLHDGFRAPVLFLPRTCIIASGPEFSLPGPEFSLSGPALLLPDLHYFTVTFPSRKIK